jgi:hypothetical protein
VIQDWLDRNVNVFHNIHFELNLLSVQLGEGRFHVVHTIFHISAQRNRRELAKDNVFDIIEERIIVRIDRKYKNSYFLKISSCPSSMKTVPSGSLLLIFAACRHEAIKFTVMDFRGVARGCSISHRMVHTKRNRQSQTVNEFQNMADEYKQESLTMMSQALTNILSRLAR